jgi:large subunit ribosomal protein L25
VQKDPVRQIIEHLDLLAVRQGEKVEVEIPVHVTGEPFSGTVALLELNTLKLEAEATHIPENVVVDIEGAVEGTQIHAKDVVLPRGSILADDPELLVVNIVVPAASRGTDEEESAAAEAPAAE